MKLVQMAGAKLNGLREVRVTPDTLNVAPHIVGVVLARPRQRMLAMAVDSVLLALLANAVNYAVGDTQRWMDHMGVSVGWALAYFTLLPYWMHGQTPGKKLLGLQIIELTGRPLTLVLCFSRYGGYAAGLATGGFGFLQVLWDPNRQSIQDKIAHTVVIDVRAADA